MAKRKTGRGGKKTKAAKKAGSTRRSGKRPSGKVRARRTRPRPKTRPAVAQKRDRTPRRSEVLAKSPRLDRVRRTLADVPTPPSSLKMDRHGSAARTGRAELAEFRETHASMTPEITAGDVDADLENAYFSGDETPGGDNPTPDQDIVDDIGKALGVEYQDNEELKSTEKLSERDKHRWELDPASSEDYRERK